MKTMLKVLSLAALLAASAPLAMATSIGIGQTVTPGAEGGTFATLADTGVIPFSFPGSGKDQGSVEQVVGTFTGNPFGLTDMTFIYIFNVTKGDVTQFTASDFSGVLTDVGVNSSNGGVFPSFAISSTDAPTNAIRTSDATIDFNFAPVQPGSTSYVLIINTNAQYYDMNGIMGLEDSGNSPNFAAYEPVVTPEPSSLMLLGTGVLGIAGAVRRRFSI